MKVAIYCRVSTEEQARDGFSIAAQKNTLKSFCKSKGWDIVKVYTDEGISGKSTNRPAFLRMLKDMESKLFEVILVWKINRFSRKNSDLLSTVEHLSKYNVNLVSCSEQFDASTPSGKLMLSMLGSIGEFERETIIENIRSGMVERAGQGLFNGGRILGYDTEDGKLIVNEEEASTVRRIFELYLSGSGFNDIQKILKSENRRTKNNCTFQISSVKRILKNPIYAGFITYNKTRKINSEVVKNSEYIISKGSHTPIISREHFDEAQRIIDSKRQAYQTYNKPNDYILSGILICPSCGGRMTGHNGNRKGNGTSYRYYICSNYKNHGPAVCRPNCTNADRIESNIIDYLCSSVVNTEVVCDVYKYINKINNPSNIYDEINFLKKELSSKKKLLDKYYNLFEHDLVDAEIFRTRAADISSEIKQINLRIESIKAELNQSIQSVSYEEVLLLLKDFKNLFFLLNSSNKRKLIYLFVKRILLNPDRSINSIELKFKF